VSVARPGWILALLVSLALVFPGSAFALTPKPGHYALIKGGRSVGVAFDVTKKHRVKAFQDYDKCATVPLLPPSIKISKKGKFSFRGTVKDVIGQKFSLTLTGKFVSRTKAKGTATLSRTSPTSCAGKKIAYTVKRQG
jgi:hypothetical protein